MDRLLEKGRRLLSPKPATYTRSPSPAYRVSNPNYSTSPTSSSSWKSPVYFPSSPLPPDNFSPLCTRCKEICITGSYIPEMLSAQERVLDAGILQDCHLCALILKNRDWYEGLGESSLLKLIVRPINEEQAVTLRWLQEKNSDRAPGESDWIIEGFSIKSGDFMISVPEEAPAAALIDRRPPLDDLGSEEAFGQMNRWLNECNEKHDGCERPPEHFLPTRLLDVGNEYTEPSVFIPPEDTTGRYVALSYCWGTIPQTVLTMDLLISERAVFPIDALPNTVRDAVIICRKLGFRYLWVDALCIIQDSPGGEDWIRQSAVMDEIYSNAGFTIVASGAPTVWHGILTETSNTTNDTCTIPFNCHLRFDAVRDGVGSGMSTLKGSKALIRYYPKSLDLQQPLSSRCWALQEQLMSHRTLSFHKEQLVWQCKAKKVYADGPQETGPSTGQRTWEDIVTQYTHCNLTFEDDRLMALSGYARFKDKEYNFNSYGPNAHTNKYLAGLWEIFLSDHLLWISEVKTPPPRPSTYRAPSWSWGSINDPIHFVPEDRKGHRDKHTSIELISSSMSTNPLNPFGTLSPSPPSYIHIKALLKPALGMEIPSRFSPMPTQASFRKTRAKNWTIDFDILDVKERMDKALLEASSENAFFFEQRLLYCLRVTEFTALIVVPVVWEKGVPMFERVGIVRHWHRSEWGWWDEEGGVERVEMHLV